ncbi:MAG: hypothetical protein KGM91_14780, partial [Burkholderiales bacterium]|nr:hypothetical protein [Burkholderiales bacterium]
GPAPRRTGAVCAAAPERGAVAIRPVTPARRAALERRATRARGAGAIQVAAPARYRRPAPERRAAAAAGRADALAFAHKRDPLAGNRRAARPGRCDCAAAGGPAVRHRGATAAHGGRSRLGREAAVRAAGTSRRAGAREPPWPAGRAVGFHGGGRRARKACRAGRQAGPAPRGQGERGAARGRALTTASGRKLPAPAEDGAREGRIDRADLLRHRPAQQGQALAIGRGRDRHQWREFEGEAGLVEHLFQGVAGVDRAQPEAPRGAVEVEQAEVGEQRHRSAAALHAGRRSAGGAHEIDLLDQGAPAVLPAEQDDPRHDEIKVGRAEATRPAHFAARVGAGADEVDVGAAVDLAAAQEEGIDAAAAGEIEEFGAAVGPAVVAAAAQDRDPHARAVEAAREQGAGAWNRREHAHRDMAHPGEQVGDDAGE